MTDETVPGSEPGTPAPDNAPVPVTLDQIRQLINEGMNERISGIQSTFDKQLSAVRKDIQKSTLAPDEIEAEERAETQRATAALARENAALRAAITHPDAFPVYEKLMAAETGEQQIALISELIRAGQAAPATDPSTETPVTGTTPTPPIDPNRPPRNITDPYNGPMTRELASAILDATPEWPRVD